MINKESMSVAVQIIKKDGMTKTDKYQNVFAVSIRNDLLIIEIMENNIQRKVEILTDVVVSLEVRNYGLF